MYLWTEFTAASQEKLSAIVAKSAMEGRLHITLPRIRKLAERLSAPDTEREKQLMRIFNMPMPEDGEKGAPSPLSFLYQGILAHNPTATIH